jgi:LDH2 family malate/lactate/ureidoglycolate dehydrogenase
VASDRRGIASHGTARLPSWEPSRSAWSTEIELLVSARTAPNAPGRVLIPGEPEAAAERRSEGHGVSLDRGHYQSLLELSDSYDLPLPESTTL